MQSDKIWDFISENKEVFLQFPTYLNYSPFPEKKYAIVEDEIITDGIQFLQLLYSDKFGETGMQRDPEFSKIRKHLYSIGINIPISKKEYDKYIDERYSIINVEYALEAVAGLDNDLYFVVPEKEKVFNGYQSSVYDIEKMYPQLFSFSGRKARACKSINGNLCGIDIFIETDIVHLKAIGCDQISFNENSLSNNILTEVVTVKELSEFSKIEKNCVFVTSKTASSLKRISEIFKEINIETNNVSLLYDIIKNISEENSSVSIFNKTVNSFIIDSILKSCDKLSKEDIIRAVSDLSRVVSLLQKKDRDYILTAVKGKINDDLYYTVEYGAAAESDSITRKLEEIFIKKNIYICTRNFLSQPAIYYYIASNNTAKRIPTDKHNISSVLIPELGGMQYLNSRIFGDSVVDSSSENAIVNVVQQFVAQKYSGLHQHRGVYFGGVYCENGSVVKALKGRPTERTKNGIIFLNSDIDINIKGARTLLKTVKTGIDLSSERLSDSIENIHTAIWIIMSAPLLQIVSPIFSTNVNFILPEGSNFTLIKKSLFENEIKYYTDGNSFDDMSIKKTLCMSMSPVVVKDASIGIIKHCSKQYMSEEVDKNGIVRKKISSLYNFSEKKNDYFLNIKIESGKGPLNNLYSKKTGISNSDFISFFGESPSKTRQAVFEIRKIFQDMIKNSIVENSSMGYYYFEMLLPAITAYYRIFGGSNIKSFIQQLFINHTQMITVTESEFISWAKSKSHKYEIQGRKVDICVFSEKDLKHKLVNKTSVSNLIATKIKTLSDNTLHNYKNIGKGPLLKKDNGKTMKVLI